MATAIGNALRRSPARYLVVLAAVFLPAACVLADDTRLPLLGATMVATGGAHSCAIVAAAVQCWGDNSHGQLGNGTKADRLTPVAVSGLGSDVIAVSAGESHTCALTGAGGVKCWGFNLSGQLGDGTAIDRSLPVAVLGLDSGVSAISAGADFTCALVTGGIVKCWGDNGYGVLGAMSLKARSPPVAVPGLPGGNLKVVAGSALACVLTAGAGVKCWGYGAGGQFTGDAPPQDVPGLTSGVIDVVAGGYHACALRDSGAMQCWGGNTSGQLGDGTNVNRYVPADVAGLGTGVVGIHAGYGHSCALLAADRIQCWGANSYGQLGDTTYADRATPADVSGPVAGPVSFAEGTANHTCVLRADTGIACWGAKAGVGSSEPGPLEAAGVLGLSGPAVAIQVEGNYACAQTIGGAMECWGYGGYGALGSGSTATQLSPVPVSGFEAGTLAMAAGHGSGHNCAVTAAGAARCWGDNHYYQLGTGDALPRTVPAQVAGLTSGVVGVATGALHACALTVAGSVWCWGSNFAGQAGDGTAAQYRATPVPVLGMGSGMSALVAGDNHTCTLSSAGAVYCWGANSYGQIGDGTTLTHPIVVGVVGLTSGVKAIAAGGNNTCALLTTGAVKCWGANDAGQIGDGTRTNRSVPVDVTGLGGGALAVATSGSQSCAVVAGGGVRCWGELNPQDPSGTFGNPIVVEGLDEAAAGVAAGHQNACALTATGKVRCWGQDNHGQLGLGVTRVAQAFPASVMVVLPTHIAVPIVDGTGNVTAGAAFSVTVESRHGAAPGSTLEAVLTDTPIALTLAVGSGPLSGNAGCTILAGGNSCTISGLSLAALQAGAVVTATRVAGDELASGNSPPFAVGHRADMVLSTASNPSSAGQPLTVVATITGDGPAPTGTVAFRHAGDPMGCIAGSAQGIQPVGFGYASCSNYPNSGRHTYGGTYSGDAWYGAARAITLEQIVGPSLFVLRQGAGSGTVASSAGGLDCGALCVEVYGAVANVIVSAAPAAGSVFLGWLGACAGTEPCQLAIYNPVQITAVFGLQPLSPVSVDIDGNGHRDALTDGLLIMRYLFGLTGNSLTGGALGDGATQTDPAQLAAELNAMRAGLDIDGNGQVDALTDGLLLIRYLFGLRGAALIGGAIGTGATRSTAQAIETYMLTLLP